jgi:hypothetical protein
MHSINPSASPPPPAVPFIIWGGGGGRGEQHLAKAAHGDGRSGGAYVADFGTEVLQFIFIIAGCDWLSAAAVWALRAAETAAFSKLDSEGVWNSANSGAEVWFPENSRISVS